VTWEEPLPVEPFVPPSPPSAQHGTANLPDNSPESSEKSSEKSLPLKVFTYDESRFGLRTILRRRITLKGIKPLVAFQYGYENTYFYGAVAPVTGESFFFEFSELNSACFQCFLDQFSQAFPTSLNILTLDNGSFHKTDDLVIPANIRFVFTPPYAPEVNPIERVWLHFKSFLADQTILSLEALFTSLAAFIASVSLAQFSSLTSFPFFFNVANSFL
jgi:transposase